MSTPRPLLLILTLSALLVACGKSLPQATSTPPYPVDNFGATSGTGAMARSLLPGETGYIDFQDGAVGNGEKSLLFFYAKWDPFSNANDATLQALYQQQPLPIRIYKVDYDTQTDLKNRYGITQSNTFVLINANGDPLKIISYPSQEDLKVLIQG